MVPSRTAAVGLAHWFLELGRRPGVYPLWRTRVRLWFQYRMRDWTCLGYFCWVLGFFGMYNLFNCFCFSFGRRQYCTSKASFSFSPHALPRPRLLTHPLVPPAGIPLIPESTSHTIPLPFPHCLLPVTTTGRILFASLVKRFYFPFEKERGTRFPPSPLHPS